jgi:hypothetical protein
MLLTSADLLCLQLDTVRSLHTTVHASNQCWLAVPTASHSTVSTHHSTCCWLAVPTAAHSTVSIHSTCFWPVLTCCAYSCTQYGLYTQYMLLTSGDLLCLQLHTVRSPHTVHASNQCWCLAVPTAAHSTVAIFSDLEILIDEPSNLYVTESCCVQCAILCHRSVMCTVRHSRSDCTFDLILIWSRLNCFTCCANAHDFGFYV